MKLTSLLNHISIGAEFVGVEFGPRIYGGRVCKGPSLLGAEFVRGRVCKGPRCPGIVPSCKAILVGGEGLLRRVKETEIPLFSV